VQYKSSLTAATWSRLKDFAELPTNRTLTVTDIPQLGPQRFYRLATPAQL
jgi:hypothetical protein